MMKSEDRARLILRPFLMTTAVSLSLAQMVAAQTTTEETIVLDQITLYGQFGTGYTAQRSTAATKTSTPLEETPVSVSVVTDEQMEDQAVQSVAQALRYSPGVASEYRGTSNIADETYIRGFGFVPIYVEGLAVSGQGVQIDPWLLQSVAAVKGPASLLYGQANPGGLIDMQLKKADGSTGTHLGFVTGTNNRIGTRFDVARAIDDRLSWRLVGHAEQADTQEEGLQTQRLTLSSSILWEPTDATSVSVYGMYQREPYAGYRNFREALGTLNPTSHGYIPGDFLVGDPDFEESERTTFSFGYTLEHNLSDATTLRQKLGATVGDWDQRTPRWGRLGSDERTVSRAITDTYDKSRQFSVDNQIEHQTSFGGGEHVILAGIDFQYVRSDRTSEFGATMNPIDWMDPDYGNAVVTGSFRTSADGIARLRQTGIYLQDQATFGNLHVQAGLRYDWAETDTYDLLKDVRVEQQSKALSGRFGLLYEMKNGFSPYISYSTSFEPVTRVPLAGEDPYDPTEGEQLEIGVKWANADDTLMVTASAYDLRQKNVLKSIEGTSPTQYEQVGEIRSRGFEFEAQGHVSQRFSMLASYSYNDSRVSKSNKPADIGTHNDRMPMHQASLWGKYEFENGWDTALGLRYVGESWARGNAFKVPGVTLFDAAVGYDFGAIDSRYEGLRGQINITNLTDEFYTSSCATAYACWVGPERQITASIDYKW